MKRRFATVDVFTKAPLTGNPVAVVLDADRLTTAQMQALAAEFNYVETTFVLPPDDPAHDAHVRIFTPDREVPFAGHPNIGTAFLLARETVQAGHQPPRRLLFEEAAGIVVVDLLLDGDTVIGAEVIAPQSLARLARVDEATAAACLGLAGNDVCAAVHPPQVVSVGLPFLVVELATRDALRRCRPDRAAYDALFPLDGAKAVYAYVRAAASSSTHAPIDLHARMFTWRLVEDPATGSASAALAALLTDLSGSPTTLRIRQGEDMGRPSDIRAYGFRGDAGTVARVGGRCCAMFEGRFDLDDVSAEPPSTEPA